MNSKAPRAEQQHVMACHVCDLVCADGADGTAHKRCPRCGALLHRRRPNSIGQTWAFLVTGMIFYIPANVLPVMHTSLFGRSGDSTILRGVLEFWKNGSYGIALIIFAASVVIPCMKFLVLGLILVTTQRHSRWSRRQRTKQYRLVESIGHWSMLDVLVVAVAAALVKFQALGNIEPREGILFFGLVVISTMLAAMSFDPRLIWDGEPR